MNIVLVHPYVVVREITDYLSEPLGLVYLATYLKKVFGEEVNVSILDLYAMGAGSPRRKGSMYVKGIDDEARIHAELRKAAPDLVGVTCCFTGYIKEALEVAAMVKRLDASIPVVMGGTHATLAARDILVDNPFVDFVVSHEGEVTLEQLVRSLMGELPIESVEGLSFRAPDSSVVETPPRELIPDLDLLPIPDRSFIDMEHYKWFNTRLFTFSRKKPIGTVITSRGCTYNCAFCSTKNMWRRQYRESGLDRVIEEIEMLVSEHGVREICILDDQFIMEKDRVLEFCDYFIERDLNIAFTIINGVSVWLADDDALLHKMRRAGFYKLTVPIESANARTMKFIRKPVDLAKAGELVSKANKLGYWTGAFFIIGFPYETREEIMETIGFAYDSELDFALFVVAQPYLGTELYDIFEKEGLLGEGTIPGTFITHAWHDTTTMTARELNDIQSRASKGWIAHKVMFYLKPRNFFGSLLPKFKTPADIRYGLGILRMLISRNLGGLLGEKG